MCADIQQAVVHVDLFGSLDTAVPLSDQFDECFLAASDELSGYFVCDLAGFLYNKYSNKQVESSLHCCKNNPTVINCKVCHSVT